MSPLADADSCPHRMETRARAPSSKLESAFMRLFLRHRTAFFPGALDTSLALRQLQKSKVFPVSLGYQV